MSSQSLFGGKSTNRKGAEQKIDSEYLSFITENETMRQGLYRGQAQAI